MVDLLHFTLEGVDGLLERRHHGAQAELAAFLQGLGFRFENLVGEQFELLAQAGFLLFEVGQLTGMAGLALIQLGLELGVLSLLCAAKRA